jgi:hypothetical protein
MPARQASRSARSGAPAGSRSPDLNDLIVMVITVTAAVLLDLAIYAFMASH